MCPAVPGNVAVLAAMAGGMDRLPVTMNTAARALDLAKKHGDGIRGTDYTPSALYHQEMFKFGLSDVPVYGVR